MSLKPLMMTEAQGGVPDPQGPGTPHPSLTRTEHRLLHALRSRPGHVFSRAELVALVMPDSIVVERTIDVHVRALRKKLGAAADPIQTVRGAGYQYKPPT